MGLIISRENKVTHTKNNKIDRNEYRLHIYNNYYKYRICTR